MYKLILKEKDFGYYSFNGLSRGAAMLLDQIDFPFPGEIGYTASKLIEALEAFKKAQMEISIETEMFITKHKKGE